MSNCVVNATRHIDLRLALPEVKENLRVEAVAPLVETETSEQGLVIGGQMIGDLPLNGRDFLRLAKLAPGVSGATDNPASPAGPFNVNGQRDLSNNILIDGINVNAGGSANGRISLAPGNDPAVGQSGSSVALVSVDAVSEFKVQTQMETAEFGGFSGAVINVTTKSGTNEFHGSGFEFLRNSDLDANNFFNNANGVSRTPSRNNFFGGTIGGPIRKDRTFFFASFEGLRQRVGVNANARVPSLAARAEAGPAIQPLIDEYPLPTGPDNGDGTAGLFRDRHQPGWRNRFQRASRSPFFQQRRFLRALFVQRLARSAPVVLSEHPFPQPLQAAKCQPFGSAPHHDESSLTRRDSDSYAAPTSPSGPPTASAAPSRFR